MSTNPKNTNLMRTLVTVFSIVVSVSIIILAALQILDVWDGSVNLFVPLLGLNSLCQAYTQWNTHRKVAYFDIAVAAFIFVCSIVVFFVK